MTDVALRKRVRNKIRLILYTYQVGVLAMSSFKIGDIITANEVGDTSGITKGCTYVASLFSHNGSIVHTINDNKESKGYFIWRFTLIDEENE